MIISYIMHAWNFSSTVLFLQSLEREIKFPIVLRIKEMYWTCRPADLLDSAHVIVLYLSFGAGYPYMHIRLTIIIAVLVDLKYTQNNVLCQGLNIKIEFLCCYIMNP